MRISTIVVGLLLVALIVLSVPEVVYTHYLETTTPSIFVEKYRGPESQSLEALRGDVKDIYRRLDLLDNQQAAVRLAVIESKLGTMFEFGRIVLGAAIMYVLEAIFRGLKWATGKSKAG